MNIRLDAAHSIVRQTGVPKGWKEYSLGELVDIIGGGTPDRDEGSYWRDGHVPWITPTDLTANSSKWISSGAEHISDTGLSHSNATLVPRGSIIFSTRGSVGKIAVAAVPLTCNQSCEILLSQPDKLSSYDFLYYLLSFGLPAFLRLSAGTTFDSITRRDIKRVLFAVPQVGSKEQEAIAVILDNTDKIIELVKEAVKQAGLTRKALMQSFFNFKHHNEPLRTTSLGRIPSTWKWVKGKKAFLILGSGPSESSVKHSNNHDEPDAWFMKVDDFNNPANRRSIVQSKVGFQTEANPKIKLLPKGTLIIAKRGAAILKNRVRISAVPLVLDPNLMGIHMYEGILPEFFAYQLEWRNLSRFLEDSGIPQMNNKDLYPRYFLKAPPEEQRKIVSTIKAAEDYEDALSDQLDAYEKLRNALMHDLLTGKVRVNHAIDQILSLEAS